MFQAPNVSAAPLTEKPTLETVREAIKTVLSHNPGADRKTAQDWLESLKNSVFAWEICDQLLLAHDEIEVSYLAAHMLRQKISKNFNELPLEYYSSLKDSILNHLKSNEDYAVQGQLTMAIADLTLLLKAWQNPIEDLAKQFGLDVGLMSLVNTDHVAIFKALHNRLIFAYIMHQMCDLNHHHSERPSRIGSKRREEFEDYLISKCSQAITWWLSTLKEAEELRSRLSVEVSANNQVPNLECPRIKNINTIDKLIGQIYLCYSAWLRIFDEENVNESLPLIDAAFRHLKEPNCPETIHKFAVEVVVATASFCEDNRAVDYLIVHLVNQVYTLESNFMQAISIDDMDKASNFVKAITSVAETACLIRVIENKDFKLMELLLSCLNHYDFELVMETYSFWWILLDHLQNRLKKSEYTPFIGYINRFIMAVTKLCQFDPDEDGVISDDHDIHAFRANTAEIISSVLYVSTVEEFVRDNQILDVFRLDLSTVHWERVESILYLLSCIVHMLTRDDNQLRTQIFNSILLQQTKVQDAGILWASKQVNIKIGVAAGEVHPQIVATSLRIIGSMESFFSENTDCLALAINYILNSINDPTYRNQLIRYAATSLCNIMELNAKHHLSHELLVIIKNLSSNLDQFDEIAASELLKCGAIMAVAIKEPPVKDQFLCELVGPVVNSLKNTLIPDNKNDKEPTKYLERLTVVFRQASVDPSNVSDLKNFILLVDTELWPTIVKVLEVYASETGRTIDQACRTTRYLVRFIKPEWMIQTIAETMINLYRRYPQDSSPLYICSILVDEFANRSPEINQGLFNMLEVLCTLTFTLLNMTASSAKSLLTMKSYPETIDDMMRLFNRFMKKCPNEFLNFKAIESIIELCISSLRIDHPDANKNVSKFATSFISLGTTQDYPHIREAIKNVLGARFTDAVIKACLFDIPSSLISEEVQILLTLHSFDKILYNIWVEASVSSLPKTNIQGIESVTSDQLEDFKKTITTAGSPKNIVNCLRAFARLYA